MMAPKSLNIAHTLHNKNRRKDEEESAADDIVQNHVDKPKDTKTRDEYSTLKETLRWDVCKNFDYFCDDAWTSHLISQLFIHVLQDN